MNEGNKKDKWFYFDVDYNSEDISDVTNTITQYLWLAKSDQNKRND